MNRKSGAALSMLLDIVIPIAGYFILHALGVNDFWALTIPGILLTANAIGNTIRRKRLDTLGLLVLIEVALSIVLLFVTRDPKIVLLKPSFYTGAAGLFLAYTCLVGRPFVLDTVKPFVTQGKPERMRAYEDAWQHDAGFRREIRTITAVWAVLWLVESAIRVLVVLHSSISIGVLAGQLPGIVVIVAGGVYTKLRGSVLERYVDARRAVNVPANSVSQ